MTLRALTMIVLLLLLDGEKARAKTAELVNQTSRESRPSTFESPDIGLSTLEMIRRRNLPAEAHQVTTEDGFLLEMHRIPRPGRPAVFLQHGLMCSSAIWVEMGPEMGLAYLLWDAGLDVWMSNSRGNTYSKRHVSLDSNDRDFWDFSWHEMGLFDVPAQLDHVLHHTGRPHLDYVGHSMGTTMFWVMTSQRPDYNLKVRQMHALAPVAFFSDGEKNPFLLAKEEQIELERLLTSLGLLEFPPWPHLVRALGVSQCKDGAMMQGFCMELYNLLFGDGSSQFNKSNLPLVLSHFPDGTSLKAFEHYTQQIDSGKFSLFDHGAEKNLARYGAREPPEYDLSLVRVPAFLHFSPNDRFSHPADVARLCSELSNCQATRQVEGFNHMDLVWGSDVTKVVFAQVVNTLTYPGSL